MSAVVHFTNPVDSSLREENLYETRKVVLMVAAVTTAVALALLLTQFSQFSSFALHGGLPITAVACVIDTAMLITFFVTSVKLNRIEQEKRMKEAAEAVALMTRFSTTSPAPLAASPSPSHVPAASAPRNDAAKAGAPPDVRVEALPARAVGAFPLNLTPQQLYDNYFLPLLKASEDLFKALLLVEYQSYIAAGKSRKPDEMQRQTQRFEQGCVELRSEIARFLGFDQASHQWKSEVLVGNYLALYYGPGFPDGVALQSPEVALNQWIKASSLCPDGGVAGNLEREFVGSSQFCLMGDLRRLFDPQPLQLDAKFLRAFLDKLPQKGDANERAIVSTVVAKLKAEAERLIALPAIQGSIQTLASLKTHPRQFQRALVSLLSQLVVNSQQDQLFFDERSKEIIQSMNSMRGLHHQIASSSHFKLHEMLNRMGAGLGKVVPKLFDINGLLKLLDEEMVKIELEMLGGNPNDETALKWATEVLSREAETNLGRYQFHERFHLLPLGVGRENWAQDPYVVESLDQYEKYTGKKFNPSKFKYDGDKKRWAVKIPKNKPRVALLLLDAKKSYREILQSDPRAKAAYDYFIATHGEDAAAELIVEFCRKVEEITIDGVTRYGIYIPTSRFNWILLQKDLGMRILVSIASSVADWVNIAWLKSQVDSNVMTDMIDWLSTFPLFASYKALLKDKFWDTLAFAFLAGMMQKYFQDTYKDRFFSQLPMMVARLEGVAKEKGENLTMVDLFPIIRGEMERMRGVLLPPAAAAAAQEGR